MHSTYSEYMIGVAFLDEQHTQLLNLTEQAKSLLKNENMLYKFDDLQTILKGLHEYTLSHFAAEEAYMQNANYAKLEEHKALHQEFIQKLSRIHENILRISLGTQDTILSELLDYLETWLQQHILLVDKEMVQQVEHGSSL